MFISSAYVGGAPSSGGLRHHIFTHPQGEWRIYTNFMKLLISRVFPKQFAFEWTCICFNSSRLRHTLYTPPDAKNGAIASIVPHTYASDSDHWRLLNDSQNHLAGILYVILYSSLVVVVSCIDLCRLFKSVSLYICIYNYIIRVTITTIIWFVVCYAKIRPRPLCSEIWKCVVCFCSACCRCPLVFTGAPYKDVF